MDFGLIYRTFDDIVVNEQIEDRREYDLEEYENSYVQLNHEECVYLKQMVDAVNEV